MKKGLPILFAMLAITALSLQQTNAQNTSPYWSLAGNSNASATTSKLGTTNSVPLRLYTNNVERVRILSTNGNVGVGTLSPTERLHVNAATGTNAFRVQVNGNTKLFVHSSGGTALGGNVTPPANGLYVAGNVGLGTATVTHRLTVSGNGRFTKGLLVNDGGLNVIHLGDDSTAIYASAPNGYGGYGVWAEGMGGVYGQGGMMGVYGSGYTGVSGSGVYGVQGDDNSNDEESAGIGVSGYSSYGIGVYGSTNNASSYAGYFSGNVFSTGSYTPSARKLKQNITDLSSAMTIIGKLQPKEYEYKHEGSYKLMHLPEGKRYGLIAEEVEEVLPGLVKATTFNTRNTKPVARPTAGVKPAVQPSEAIAFKAVNYNELIPIMVKGMQEQEAENIEKDKRIASLETEVAELRQMMLELKNGRTGSVNVTSAYLEQNAPNPVNGTTTIRYNVPEASTSARLTLTNAKGQVVKTISLSNRGTGQISLNTSQLAIGTYHYTLYVDGKQTDTKRLVVAR